jgi:hypothetical protein
MPGVFADLALATDGQHQVGYFVQVGAPESHAVMWNGSAASAVSLHPSGAVQSQAVAAADGLEGGWVQFTSGGGQQAVIWAGSAQSLTNLHPGPSFTESQVLGMASGQQVGWAQTLGHPHAALWRGNAATFMDLNPSGSDGSRLYGTCGSAQVGYASFGGVNSAAIWFGSSQNFVSLPLPAGYFQSVATCVAEANGIFYVGGYATTSVNPHDEAFMWVSVPGPGSACVAFCGSVLSLRRRRRT